MTKGEIERLCEKRGLPFKMDFLMGLSKEQYNDGLIMFYIPDSGNIDNIWDEHVWGWVSKSDREKLDGSLHEVEVPAILCNVPLNFCGILWNGSEVMITKWAGNYFLSKRWIEDNIFSAPWFKRPKLNQ